MSLKDCNTAPERREYIEKECDVTLDTVGKALMDREGTFHCENVIGATTIPLGVAGPMLVQGSHVDGEYYVPLATTEGALIASVSRGCKAARESGGINMYADRVGTSRGPVFATKTLEESKRLVSWINENKNTLIEKAEETSSHLTVTKIEVKILPSYVFLRCSYNTDDAMGMNMVTIATEKIASHIQEKTGCQCLAVAGNYDIDKKPAWLNFISQRGITAWGEVILPAEVVENVLKTTPKRVFDTWLGKCMIGSAMSGSLGFNSHFANIVAALYAATGQDLAHVVEGSLGMTICSVLGTGDLYFSVYMPCLMLGTVGGGTKLKTQTEARSILGVKKSTELAEIVAGAVLSGELSLLASLSEGTLARAHKQLGR